MVKRLLNLNGIATFNVVLYHTTGWVFTAMFWWVHRYQPVTSPNFEQIGSLAYYLLRLIEQVIIFTIPSFLFISGYFIAVAAGRNAQTVGWNVIRNRVISLAIPYLLWSLVIFASDAVINDEVRSVLDYGKLLLVGGAADPYYFIPMLIQMYLLSRFLVPLARRRPLLLLVVSGLLQLTVLLLRYPNILGQDTAYLGPLNWLNYSWLFPGFIFWFSFGVVVSFHSVQFKQILARFKPALLPALLILLAGGILEWESLFRLSGLEWIGPQETLIDHLYALVFILTYLAYEQFQLPLADHFANLGGKSFGIYLTHAPILEYTSKAVYHLLPVLLGMPLVFLVVLVTFGLSLPLAAMAIVRRSPLNKFYVYLFG